MKFEGVLCDACRTPIAGAVPTSLSRWWERIILLTNVPGIPNDATDGRDQADVCEGCAVQWFLDRLLKASRLIK